jgi:hypothetical protein
MIKHLKTIKASIIIGILLISLIPFLVTHDSTASAALISFHSYMDLNYDPSILNKPLEIDVAMSIPITVSYWTDIPDIFSKIPYPLNNLILFGNPIGPMQKIHLELLQTPEWANIYFSSPDIITDIPFKSDGVFTKNTTLIISPKMEAPAEPQRISIKVSCESIKRINGFSFQKDIPFTPSFIPTISIQTDNPIRTSGPHQSISFRIVVQNMGNKITQVTPKIIGADEKWTTTINPPNLRIYPNQEGEFVFSLITPYDFGWHSEYGRFEINFLSEVYPISTSGSASSSESIYLIVNNNGFSLPGFEFPLLIIAFAIILVFLQKRRHRN